ncbi:MAG: hypothetical protein E7262_00555 [Lachnospiraceae bacterium]|nr:hypothetical protein [Lachnospiraceae bacterium]
MGNKSIKDVWSENKMIEYILEYRKFCSQLNEGTSKNDIKRHNLAMKKLSELYYKIEPQEDKSFVLELLNEKNIRIGLLVASHCLGWGIYIKEAKNVLKKISKSSENQEIAFDAKMTLEVYKEQGYLKF